MKERQKYEQNYDDEAAMRLTLEHARLAYKKGETPIGAAIIRDGKLIAASENAVERLRDATAHAEMRALRRAQKLVGDWRLNDCDLFVSKEPCVMCAGAILRCRVRRVVFACADERFGGAGGFVDLLREKTFNHRCEIESGLLADEARELLQSFFKKARKKNVY